MYSSSMGKDGAKTMDVLLSGCRRREGGGLGIGGRHRVYL